MAYVTIPESHFLKSAKKQHSDLDTVIIREALQNSVDAGAKRIDIKVDDESFEIIDDGHGMDESRMVEAMLTFGGTYKEGNSIGGFGAAKEVLLFPHKSYRLISRDVHVEGKVLEYELKRTESSFPGTSLKFWFHSDYQFKASSFLRKTEDYLASCDLCSIKIYVNGKQFSNWNRKGSLVRDLGWGLLYCRSTRQSNDQLIVRVNGVTMFRVWVSSIKKSLVLELTESSTDVLVANRESLRWEKQNRLSELIEEITVDKSSFGKLYDAKICVPGRFRSFTELVELVEETEVQDIPEEPEVFVDQVLGKLREVSEEKYEEVAAKVMNSTDKLGALKEGVTALLDSSDVSLDAECDFYIDVRDKGYNTLPLWLYPSKMGKQKSRLIKLWKRCLQLVMRANGIEMAFCIGWILDVECEAKYSRKNDVNIFQINPNSKLPQPKSSFLKLLAVAAHEIAHTQYKYHDENFTGYYEKLLTTTLIKLDSWWNEYVSSTSEKI